MTKAETIITMIRYGEALKKIDRSGWVLAGVNSKRIESVAEHSYGSVLSSIVIAQQLKSIDIEINIGKVALMAALHDLPESITGDIARTKEFLEDINRVKAKDLAEMNAITEIIEPMGETFQSLFHVWKEFNLGESIEARVVKGADIIDMLIHARSLEESGISPKSLDQFFETSRSLIKLVDIEIVTEIYNKLCNEHNAITRTQSG